MDFFTLIGIIAGIGFIVGSILMSTSITTFVDAPSIMIVAGGTVASTFISFSGSSIMAAMKDMVTVMFKHKIVYMKTIDEIVDLAQRSLKEGMLGIEKVKVQSTLMQRGIILLTSGINPDKIQRALTIEKQAQTDRAMESQAILEKMGDFSPAWGMVGTLIGLVIMMLNISDPSSIGPSMAVALLTTFYGAVFANLIFIPVATKIEQRAVKNQLHHDLIIEGIISIALKENPRMIKEKLVGFLTDAASGGDGKSDGKAAAPKKK